MPKPTDRETGVGQHAPVGREEVVEAVGGPLEEQGPDDQGREQDDQQRDEDLSGPADALLNSRDEDAESEQPYNDQHARDERHEVQAEAGPGAEEVLREEGGGFLIGLAPAAVDGEPGVAGRPREDHRVVDGDHEGHQHLDPTDRLGETVHAAETQGSGAAEPVADGVVEEQQGDTGGEQRDQIRDEERAAAVVIGDEGKTPDVAEADGGADGGEHEDGAPREGLASPGTARGGGCGHGFLLSGGAGGFRSEPCSESPTSSRTVAIW